LDQRTPLPEGRALGMAREDLDLIASGSGATCGTLSKMALPFSLVALMALGLGACFVLAGGLPYKWVFVLTAAGCFPLLVIALGSLKKALVLLLILSLSMQMDVHLGYSDKYAVLKPGVAITLKSLLLLGLYAHWLFNSCRAPRSIRLFPWLTIPLAILVLWSGLSFVVAAQPSNVLSQFPRALEAFFIFFSHPIS